MSWCIQCLGHCTARLMQLLACVCIPVMPVAWMTMHGEQVWLCHNMARYAKQRPLFQYALTLYPALSPQAYHMHPTGGMMHGVVPRYVQHSCGCAAGQMQASSSGAGSCAQLHIQQQGRHQGGGISCRRGKQLLGGQLATRLPLVALVQGRCVGLVMHWPCADEGSAYLVRNGEVLLLLHVS